MKIQKALDASPDLKDKKELVERFIDSQTPGEGNILDQWEAYVIEHRKQELAQIIADEKLKEDETIQFMRQSFEDGSVNTNGLAITKLMPPMPIFGAGAGKRAEKKKNVIGKLEAFFNRFFNLIEDNNI